MYANYFLYICHMISSELRSFVENEIIPKYDGFDAAHQRDHVETVIRESLHLASVMGVDDAIAYVTAAYHDLGLCGPRESHHLLSGSIIRADERLLRWFSPSEIETIAQAAEDHRASAKTAPRSVYGKIVSEADRNLSPETVVRRTIQYSFKHFPDLDREGNWQRTHSHLLEKYSRHGYIKLWIEGGENEIRLRELWRLTDDANVAELREMFDRIYDKLKNE